MVVQGFIPRPCISNVTMLNSTCCPSLLLDAPNEICGGPNRGECLDIVLYPRPTQEKYSKVENIDDRIDWPLRFFNRACFCKEPYHGFGCEKIRQNDPSKRIRKNLLNLTNREREILVGVLSASKFKSSDYLVINATSSENCDPTLPESLQPDMLVNVSIYDAFVYLHFYTTRSTMKRNAEPMIDNCNADDNILNYAHRGPGFFPWHRYFLILFEDELSILAEELYGVTNFALPYWDWVNEKNCSICVIEIYGKIESPVQWPDPWNMSETRYKPTPDTMLWDTLCRQEIRDNGCHICNPGEGLFVQPALWRRISPKYRILPTQKQIDYLMSISDYDADPYDRTTTTYRGFRNMAEGHILYGLNRSDFNEEMANRFSEIFNNVSESEPLFHNYVHNTVNGSFFDLANSPNDPLFYAHHVYMDKIYEMWLLKYGSSDKYPTSENIPYGHHPEDFIVPLFPLKKNRDYFKLSTEFGYQYDNNYLGTSLIVEDSITRNSVRKIIVGSVIGVGIALLLFLLLITLLIKKFGHQNHPKHMVLEEDDVDGEYADPNENDPEYFVSTSLSSQSKRESSFHSEKTPLLEP